MLGDDPEEHERRHAVEGTQRARDPTGFGVLPAYLLACPHASPPPANRLVPTQLTTSASRLLDAQVQLVRMRNGVARHV